MFRPFVIWMILMINSVYASQSQSVVSVGDTKVTIKQIQNGPGKSFIHVHQNEKTALQAAQHIVESEGGSLMTLIHPGQRNIRPLA